MMVSQVEKVCPEHDVAVAVGVLVGVAVGGMLVAVNVEVGMGVPV
jgi:hypothetical protein